MYVFYWHDSFTLLLKFENNSSIKSFGLVWQSNFVSTGPKPSFDQFIIHNNGKYSNSLIAFNTKCITHLDRNVHQSSVYECICAVAIIFNGTSNWIYFVLRNSFFIVITQNVRSSNGKQFEKLIALLKVSQWNTRYCYFKHIFVKNTWIYMEKISFLSTKNECEYIAHVAKRFSRITNKFANKFTKINIKIPK